MEDKISRKGAIDSIVKLTNFHDVETLLRYASSPLRYRGWIGGIADAITVLREAESTGDDGRDDSR